MQSIKQKGQKRAFLGWSQKIQDVTVVSYIVYFYNNNNNNSNESLFMRSKYISDVTIKVCYDKKEI